MKEKNAFGKEQLAALFKNRHERPGEAFRETLDMEDIVVAPGVHNAKGAGIAKDKYLLRKAAGLRQTYNAVYLGGWSVSAMLFGRPDMGFVPLPAMTLVGQYAIPAAYPLPVIMDAETGFAPEAVGISDTVRAYHGIGVALAHLEDQSTRRCGNLGGKWCAEIEEMETKIRCWLIASEEMGTSMQLMARTDALTAANGGLENAIERGKRYMDVEYKGRRPLVLWADAMQDPAVIERWITEMRRHDPKMILGINYSPNKDWTAGYRAKFKREPPTYQDLYDNGNGFRLIWHTTLQARIDMEAAENTFDDMAENGAETLWKIHDRQRGMLAGDPQAMSGAPLWQAFDQFIGGAAAAQRYKDSAGYGSETREEKK